MALHSIANTSHDLTDTGWGSRRSTTVSEPHKHYLGDHRILAVDRPVSRDPTRECTSLELVKSCKSTVKSWSLGHSTATRPALASTMKGVQEVRNDDLQDAVRRRTKSSRYLSLND